LNVEERETWPRASVQTRPSSSRGDPYIQRGKREKGTLNSVVRVLIRQSSCETLDGVKGACCCLVDFVPKASNSRKVALAPWKPAPRRTCGYQRRRVSRVIHDGS
jgi:hypothetical protein